MKKVLALLAATVSVLFLTVSCSSEITLDDEDLGFSASRAAVKVQNLKTFTQANEIYDLTCLGYNEGVKGPIVVTKGTLKTFWSKKTVYLVTLSGTELIDNQSTGLFTDLLVGFNQDNSYLQNVVSVITSNIPKNSNLILAGHSLG